MKIVETILQQIGNLSKPKQKFIMALFSTIFILCGHVNFTNQSRYSNLSEKTFRRHFSQPFPFSEFNYYLIQEALADNSAKIIAIDSSFIPKSGKLTYGNNTFFDSSLGKAKKGLEISVISVIDLDMHHGYALSVLQTPPPEFEFNNLEEDSHQKNQEFQTQDSSTTKDTESTRVDAYLSQRN